MTNNFLLEHCCLHSSYAMQRGLYESPDIQAAIQQALLQGINPGVLRGIEGGTLHFVTVQRSGDQEYIDHVSTSFNHSIAD